MTFLKNNDIDNWNMFAQETTYEAIVLVHR